MRRFWFIVVALLFSTMLHAAQRNVDRYRCVRYDMRSGLSTSIVNDIIRDANGFVWLATDNGLTRFDGYEFRNFRSDLSGGQNIRSNTLLSLSRFHDVINVVTAKGLEFYDQRKGVSIVLDDPSLINLTINCAVSVDDKVTAIGTSGGLFIYDMASREIVEVVGSLKGSPMHKDVTALYRDSYDNIWVGCGNGEIWYYESRSSSISYLVSLPSRISSFEEMRNRNLLVGTTLDGVYKYDLENDRFNHILACPHSCVKDMDADGTGRIWIVGNEGLCVLRLQRRGNFVKEEVYIDDDSLASSDLTSVLCDRDGNIWFSIRGSGIAMLYMPDDFVKEMSFSGSNVINSVVHVTSGEFWAAVENSGLVRVDDRTFSEKPLGGKLSQLRNKKINIKDFVAGDESDLMYGISDDCLYEFDLSSPNDITFKESLLVRDHDESGSILCAIPVSRRHIWTGCQRGVSIMELSGTPRTLFDPQDLNIVLGYTPVSALLEDSSGHIWIGTSESGLYKVVYNHRNRELNSWILYDVRNGGIGNNSIRCLYEDSKGNIYAGTSSGGLYVFSWSENSFVSIENPHLFPSDNICSIEEDTDGKLWISTGNGFVCYDPQSGSPSLVTYGMHNGLNNLLFSSGASACHDGRVVFGGYSGLTSFNVSDTPSEHAELTPFFTDISYTGKSEQYSDCPPFTSKVSLDSSSGGLSLTFAAPCFTNARYLRYAYSLSGFEGTWHYVTSENRTITYSNLKPGKYKFYVKVAGESSQWSAPAILEIEVNPSIFLSSSAMALYFLIFVFLLVLSIWLVRNRMQIRHRLEIEKLERRKSDELNNAKLDFFANISHELFTPITIMSCSLDEMCRESESLSQYNIFKSNLERLKRLLQQIMDFRKADTSNLRLRVSLTDVTAFVKGMCEMNFATFGKVNNISLFFHSETPSITGYVDTDKLDKILYNLISNAYKYNRNGGSVYVSLTQPASGSVTISVKDTGRGFSPDALRTVFQRFYEDHYDSFHQRGNGIGLSLTKDLIDVHKGTINVLSTEGAGAEFIVTLPIDRSSYSDTDIEDASMDVETENCLFSDLPSDVDMILPSDDAYVEAENESSDSDSRKRLAVMIVEDNEELMSVMSRILGKRYEIYTASDGRQALEKLSDTAVDVIITDYVMPEMDGAQLCKAVRADIAISHIPIIMLSAKNNLESRVESLDSGADVYVSKPFSLNLLISYVESLVRNRKIVTDKFREASDYDADVLDNLTTDADKEFLDKAVKVIHDNISNPDFNINEFTAQMYMSGSTLYRKMTALTGMSPKEFIRNIRFKYACGLLEKTQMNVSEIAFAVGFTDAKYFSQCFKAEFGLTPSQFKTKHNNNN